MLPLAAAMCCKPPYEYFKRRTQNGGVVRGQRGRQVNNVKGCPAYGSHLFQEVKRGLNVLLVL